MSSLSTPDSPLRRRRARPLLGTIVEIEAAGGELAASDRLDSAIAAAFAAIAQVGREMSVHDPASDLSRVNGFAHRAPVRVPAWTAEVLDLALRFARESDGAFDPAVGGELARIGALPRPVRGRRYGRSSYRDVTLERDDDGSSLVRFARPLLLDFGGIAKGFAVDRALAALGAAGCAAGLVNAGGDLAHFGATEVAVEIRDPRAPGVIATLVALSNEALASSSTAFSRRRLRGAWVNHLIDPALGRCVADGASASVVAPTCAVADALTKVALFAPRRFAEIAARHGARQIALAPAAAGRRAS